MTTATLYPRTKGDRQLVLSGLTTEFPGRTDHGCPGFTHRIDPGLDAEQLARVKKALAQARWTYCGNCDGYHRAKPGRA